jgi:hypothetical protein
VSAEKLRDAIATFFAAPNDESGEELRALLNALLETELLVVEDGEVGYEEIDDRIYLALFTDPIEAHSFDNEATPGPMSADRAIQLVAQGEYGGLVINPAGQRFALSAEDVADFFDTGS